MNLDDLKKLSYVAKLKSITIAGQTRLRHRREFLEPLYGNHLIWLQLARHFFRKFCLRVLVLNLTGSKRELEMSSENFENKTEIVSEDKEKFCLAF